MLVAATIGLISSLAALCVYDIRLRRLPDWLTLPLTAGGLLVVYAHRPAALSLHLLAVVMGYLAFWVVGYFYRHVRGVPGLGLGDAKLLAAAGAWLGPFALAPVVLVAATSALMAAGVMALMGRTVGLQTALPFGPFLSLGFFLLWVARLAGWAVW